ncbi:MAG: hypothetical protein Q8P67_07355 [archaeon]|nr:hypothetical protein [archaeon]
MDPVKGVESVGAEEEESVLNSVDAQIQLIEKTVVGFYASVQADREVLNKIHTDIQKTQGVISGLVKRNAQVGKLARVEAASARLNELAGEMIPRTGSLFVRLMLGRVNVKHYSVQDRQQLKSEYEKFKSRTAWIFLGFVVLQLALFETDPSSPLAILFQVWLLYYYTTLALREHILKVNGSRVKPWWIYHHYLSIAISGTSLLWNTPSFAVFYPQFLLFSLYQSTLQILLNRYQQARLYKQRALGKATRLDVGVEQELMVDQGSSFSCAPNLLILFPLIVGAHFFQLYNALKLFQFSLDGGFEHQPIIMGCLFLVVAVGNFVSTIEVYYQKWRSQDKSQDKSE